MVGIVILKGVGLRLLRIKNDMAVKQYNKENKALICAGCISQYTNI